MYSFVNLFVCWYIPFCGWWVGCVHLSWDGSMVNLMRGMFKAHSDELIWPLRWMCLWNKNYCVFTLNSCSISVISLWNVVGLICVFFTMYNYQKITKQKLFCWMTVNCTEKKRHWHSNSICSVHMNVIWPYCCAYKMTHFNVWHLLIVCSFQEHTHTEHV